MFTVTDNSANSPVILHAPHGGRTIPSRFLPSFVVDEHELEAEKDAMTDHHTDALVESITGTSSIVNHLSRLALDVERFPDDTEEMNAVGMGVLYTHGSRRQELRRPTSGDRKSLLAIFDDYSARFAELVDATLDRHGHAVIIDVHSYPEHPLPYELHADQPRPQLCIGFNRFHAPPEFIARVEAEYSLLWAPPVARVSTIAR
jgi:N-formylglutamate amidohydrolase